MAQFIGKLPQPLLDDLVSGAWLPIVGAGFSRNAEYDDGQTPADWAGLGDDLGRAVAGSSAGAPPIEAISAYEHAFGRVSLVDRVGTLIRAYEGQPGAAHIAFAKVGFTNVITTNFDFLLERAYDKVRKGCLPVLDEAQLSAPNRSAGPRIIKFHGDLHHPSRLILTEKDYDQFLIKFPLLATSVAAMLIEYTGVLLGYSLDDPDTRQLLALLKTRLGSLRRPLWTIQFEAKSHTISRFERRGVKVVNLRLGRNQSIGAGYAQVFDELAEYWRTQVQSQSVSTDDRVTADLRLPKHDGRRLCYFAIPVNLIGWYRDNVFPDVEASGLVPVVAREVFSAPGTALTKVDALIDSAVAVVAEIDSDATSYEAALALARKGNAHVLLVQPEDRRKGEKSISNVTHWNNLVANARVLQRPSFDADPAIFSRELRRWLETVEKSTALQQEPSRLLASHAYGPALISAVSVLEVTLGQAIGKARGRELSRTSLRALVREARDMQLIESDAELEDIDDAITKRNEAVHQVARVTADDAKRGVAAILKVVSRVTPR